MKLSISIVKERPNVRGGYNILASFVTSVIFKINRNFSSWKKIHFVAQLTDSFYPSMFLFFMNDKIWLLKIPSYIVQIWCEIWGWHHSYWWESSENREGCQNQGMKNLISEYVTSLCTKKINDSFLNIDGQKQ